MSINFKYLVVHIFFALSIFYVFCFLFGLSAMLSSFLLMSLFVATDLTLYIGFLKARLITTDYKGSIA